MIDTELAGRVALVTGANSPLGIGAAVARALAAQGVQVALAFLPRASDTTVDDHPAPGPARYDAANSADGRQVRDEIVSAGGVAELLPVDLADPHACVDIFDRAADSLGSVEILVNNAAYCRPDTFIPAGGTRFHSEMTPITGETIDAHLAVNTRAPALLMAEFHRRHLARAATWGRVLNISTDGADAFPSEVSYGASKSALESLTRSAAHELGPAGITANIISPGPIQTGWIADDMLADIDRDTPLGRVGKPEDVADVAVFLTSAQARWITGQTIYVGGGHRMV
ncbi:MAG TPA: SDR family oxidoreductase [Mycobacteriales bacterium]